MIILLIYWILTTIYGTYWLVKHPSDRRYEDDDEFMDYDGDDASTWPGANYGDEDEWLDNDDLEDFDKWSKKLPDMTYKPKHSQSLTDEDGMPW